MNPKSLTAIFCATGLSISCVALTQLCFPAHFETVDDINFTLLLSGVGLTHAPTYQTWFTNIAITNPLMQFYQWMPDVAWYSIYLVSALTIAFSLICLVFMLRFGLRTGGFLFIIYFALAGAYILNGLQYTSTTAVLTQAAFLLAFCLPATNRFRSHRYPFALLILSALAAVFASMMRFEPFLLVVLISSITVLTVLAGKQINRKQLTKPALCILSALLIAFAAKTASNYFYDSKPQFAGIRDFFKPFSDLADSDRYKVKEQISLSDNDYDLVKQFFVADKNVFTTQSLNEAVASSALPFTAEKLLWVLGINIFPLILFSAVIAWFLDKRIMSMPRLATWLAALIGLMLYLAFFMKLPTRVHLTLLTCTITTLFTFIDRRKLKQLRKVLEKGSITQRVAIAAAFAILGGGAILKLGSELLSDSTFYQTENKRAKSAISKLTLNRDQLYVILGTDTPYNFMLPFENIRSQFQDFDIYRTSLWGRLPAGEAMLAAHGLKDLESACKSEKGKVLFISNAEANKRFTEFCRQHYKLTVELIPKFSDPNLNWEIYELKN